MRTAWGILGIDLPTSHPNTVGWLTPNDRATTICVYFEQMVRSALAPALNLGIANVMLEG
jgi:hypothetical protein